ncbi:MAG: helix-turn-helix domain-containing protein [Verrucomicrobiales bacterium]
MPLTKRTSPLAEFPLFDSNCVEEAESMLSQSLAGCHIKSVADRKQFNVQMDGLKIGRTSLVYNRYGTDSKIESELPGEPVFFVLGSGKPSTFNLGNRTTSTVEPVLIANARRMEIDRPKDSGVLTLRVSLPDLEHHLETQTHRHHRGRLVFDRDMDLGNGEGGFLNRLVQFLVAELERDASVAGNPVFRRNFEEMLLNGLLALPNNRSGVLFDERPHEVSPGIVSRAEEYMRANLGEPVTISDLVRICDCGRSALFSAFHNSKGISPMEFLTEQRLQSARRKLLKPEEETSVSSVALDSGFVHLGRFAHAYRKRFGESPSETLKRAKFRSP